ncbi:MAG: ROK family protein [Desulfobacterota bacterium]|nr:ROK family protein [Thermodesulfobacteriota bacterium]
MKQDFYIGIDIGGTVIKAGLFNADGVLHRKLSIPTPRKRSIDHFLDALVTAVQQLCPDLDPTPPIGIGIAGILDFERTTVLESPNLPFLQGVKVFDLAYNRFNTSVFLENDANCAALGELWVGEGKDLDNFLLYTIGTGIGSGIILDKKLWTGEQGKAGEFGHIIVNPNGSLCSCGKVGCLEAEASGSAIIRSARQALLSGASSALLYQVGTGFDEVTPEHVYHAACAGDSTCLEILRQCATFLAIGMSNVNNLLDIHHFIIGGGVGTALRLVHDHLSKMTKKMLFNVSKEKLTIHYAALGNDAGMFGAGFLARRHKY